MFSLQTQCILLNYQVLNSYAKLVEYARKVKQLLYTQDTKITKKITFQRQSWFSENPWELKIYLSFLFQTSEHTWLWVFTEFISLPVSMFQNFIVLSEDPPPVARRFLCHGHHASAFTAALCPWSWYLIFAAVMSQIMAKLSLLPEAKPHASCFSPQTSPRWP